VENGGVETRAFSRDTNANQGPEHDPSGREKGEAKKARWGGSRDCEPAGGRKGPPSLHPGRHSADGEGEGKRQKKLGTRWPFHGAQLSGKRVKKKKSGRNLSVSGRTAPQVGLAFPGEGGERRRVGFSTIFRRGTGARLKHSASHQPPPTGAYDIAVRYTERTLERGWDAKYVQ